MSLVESSLWLAPQTLCNASLVALECVNACIYVYIAFLVICGCFSAQNTGVLVNIKRYMDRHTYKGCSIGYTTGNASILACITKGTIYVSYCGVQVV
jgi:hypothetical protein